MAHNIGDGKAESTSLRYHLMMATNPIIALLHGWGTDPRIWASVREQIESRSMNAVVYEMPGYGSRLSEESDMTLEQLAEDALGRMPEGAIWVGWSLGAMIALTAARTAAIKNVDHIAGVMAVCATAKFCRDTQKSEALSLLQQSVEKNSAKAVRRFQRSMPSFANRKSIARQFDAANCFPNKETLMAGLSILSRADLTEEASKIDVPVQFVSGQEDLIIPAVAGRELHALVPNSRFSVLPCGHVPFLECPSLFMEQLFEFVESIRH